MIAIVLEDNGADSKVLTCLWSGCAEGIDR